MQDVKLWLQMWYLKGKEMRSRVELRNCVIGDQRVVNSGQHCQPGWAGRPAPSESAVADASMDAERGVCWRGQRRGLDAQCDRSGLGQWSPLCRGIHESRCAR